MPEPAAFFYLKNMLPSTLLMMSTQLLAAGVFTVLEDWSYGTALYHCIVTATTRHAAWPTEHGWKPWGGRPRLSWRGRGHAQCGAFPVPVLP